MASHTAFSQAPQINYYVYWQQTPRQLFAFRDDVWAAGPVQAREAFAAKRKDFVIGVKEAASNGRTARGGRWLA
jgi:hypothetical protein